MKIVLAEDDVVTRRFLTVMLKNLGHEVTATADGEIRATQLMKIEHRFAGLDFFPNGNRMLVRDYDRERKWGRTFLAPITALLAAEPKLLFERSVQDRYGDPGSPFMRQLPSGHSVIRTAGDPAGDTFFLRGDGASAKGDRPFLDKYDLKTGKAERLFQSSEGGYEEVVRVLNVSGCKLCLRGGECSQILVRPVAG